MFKKINLSNSSVIRLDRHDHLIRVRLDGNPNLYRMYIDRHNQIQIELTGSNTLDLLDTKTPNYIDIVHSEEDDNKVYINYNDEEIQVIRTNVASINLIIDDINETILNLASDISINTEKIRVLRDDLTILQTLITNTFDEVKNDIFTNTNDIIVLKTETELITDKLNVLTNTLNSYGERITTIEINETENVERINNIDDDIAVLNAISEQNTTNIDDLKGKLDTVANSLGYSIDALSNSLAIERQSGICFILYPNKIIAGTTLYVCDNSPVEDNPHSYTIKYRPSMSSGEFIDYAFATLDRQQSTIPFYYATVSITTELIDILQNNYCILEITDGKAGKQSYINLDCISSKVTINENVNAISTINYSINTTITDALNDINANIKKLNEKPHFELIWPSIYTSDSVLSRLFMVVAPGNVSTKGYEYKIIRSLNILGTSFTDFTTVKSGTITAYANKPNYTYATFQLTESEMTTIRTCHQSFIEISYKDSNNLRVVTQIIDLNKYQNYELPVS